MGVLSSVARLRWKGRATITLDLIPITIGRGDGGGSPNRLSASTVHSKITMVLGWPTRPNVSPIVARMRMRGYEVISSFGFWHLQVPLHARTTSASCVADKQSRQRIYN